MRSFRFIFFFICFWMLLKTQLSGNTEAHPCILKSEAKTETQSRITAEAAEKNEAVLSRTSRIQFASFKTSRQNPILPANFLNAGIVSATAGIPAADFSQNGLAVRLHIINCVMRC